MSKFEEQTHQTTVFEWIHWNHLSDVCFHPANERHCAAQQGAKFKRLGVKKGVSDIFVMRSSRGFHGLIIELKSKTGKLSSEQKYFLETMNREGYLAKVCYSADEAIKTITDYLGWKETRWL